MRNNPGEISLIFWRMYEYYVCEKFEAFRHLLNCILPYIGDFDTCQNLVQYVQRNFYGPMGIGVKHNSFTRYVMCYWIYGDKYLKVVTVL